MCRAPAFVAQFVPCFFGELLGALAVDAGTAMSVAVGHP